jgi:hypothetical protein
LVVGKPLLDGTEGLHLHFEFRDSKTGIINPMLFDLIKR